MTMLKKINELSAFWGWVLAPILPTSTYWYFNCCCREARIHITELSYSFSHFDLI